MLRILGETGAVDFVMAVDRYYEAPEPSPRRVERLENAYEIAAGIFVGPIDDSDVDRLVNACEPLGENHHQNRQYWFPYAFWHDLGKAPFETFDKGGRLYTAVFLSRLIHPTSIGFEHAGTIRRHEDSRIEIVPYEVSEIPSAAFVVDADQDWLLPEDLLELKDLILAFYATQHGARVKAAMWFTEMSYRSYFVETRWPLVTTALEALVKIPNERTASGKYAGSTNVFVDRVLQLASNFPALQITETELRDMYRVRSAYAHGTPMGALTAANRALIRKKETLLRLVVRRCIADHNFASIFKDDASIAVALPLR